MFCQKCAFQKIVPQIRPIWLITWLFTQFDQFSGKLSAQFHAGLYLFVQKEHRWLVSSHSAVQSASQFLKKSPFQKIVLYKFRKGYWFSYTLNILPSTKSHPLLEPRKNRSSILLGVCRLWSMLCYHSSKLGDQMAKFICGLQPPQENK